MTTPYSFFHRKYTVTDDGAPISDAPILLWNMDIQVQTKAVDFGDANGQNLELSVGDFYGNPTNTPSSLKDIWVKNHTATETGYIVVTGQLAQ